MSTEESTIYECAHGRIAGDGICFDCGQPVAAVCLYCGAGIAQHGEAGPPPPTPSATCASCGESYPWVIR